MVTTLEGNETLAKEIAEAWLLCLCWHEERRAEASGGTFQAGADFYARRMRPEVPGAGETALPSARPFLFALRTPTA